MLERIETFTTDNIGHLEIDVNAWLKERVGKIEVVDRKFAMCTVAPADYPSERNPQFGYVIVYRAIKSDEYDTGEMKAVQPVAASE